MFLKTNLSISSSKNVLWPEQKVFLDDIFLAETNNCLECFRRWKRSSRQNFVPQVIETGEKTCIHSSLWASVLTHLYILFLIYISTLTKAVLLSAGPLWTYFAPSFVFQAPGHRPACSQFIYNVCVLDIMCFYAVTVLTISVFVSCLLSFWVWRLNWLCCVLLDFSSLISLRTILCAFILVKHLKACLPVPWTSCLWRGVWSWCLKAGIMSPQESLSCTDGRFFKCCRIWMESGWERWLLRVWMFSVELL